MKPKHSKEIQAKEVRGIFKRLREINVKRHELGYYQLKKPIRHGWYKEIQLTENVVRYKNEKAIQEVYKKIEKKFWGINKEEATKRWFKEVSKSIIYKGLPTLSHKSFNKLSDQAKRLCVVYVYRDCNNKRRQRFYVKIPKGAYRIRFKRAYVTHRKRMDPKLEQESDLLWQQLEKKGYYEAHHKLFNYRCINYEWDGNPVHKNRKQVKLELKQLKRLSIDEIIKE